MTTPPHAGARASTCAAAVCSLLAAVCSFPQAPEILEEHPATCQSDVYAYGVTMWEASGVPATLQQLCSLHHYAGGSLSALCVCRLPSCWPIPGCAQLALGYRMHVWPAFSLACAHPAARPCCS